MNSIVSRDLKYHLGACNKHEQTNLRKHLRRPKSSQKRVGRYYNLGTDNLQSLVYCPALMWIISSSMRYRNLIITKCNGL